MKREKERERGMEGEGEGGRENGREREREREREGDRERDRKGGMEGEREWERLKRSEDRRKSKSGTCPRPDAFVACKYFTSHTHTSFLFQRTNLALPHHFY